MNSFTMQIKGKSKARPRVTRRGTYNEPKYTAWKNDVAKVGASKLERLDGDVDLVCRFTFANKVHGDLDNLVGGIMDALNGIAYKDDKQVKAINAGMEVTGENTIYVAVSSMEDVSEVTK